MTKKKLTAEQIRAFITVAEFMEERGAHKLELYANKAFNRFDSAATTHDSQMHESERHVTLASAVEAAFDFDEAPTEGPKVTGTPLPRSVDEINAEFRRRVATPFDFGADDLLAALPFNVAREHLKPEVTEEQWAELTKNTREKVLADMREYASFAWGKVEGHRGISASRNLNHYESWCWLLGDDETVAMLRGRTVGYAPYGAPKLAAVCRKYDLPIPNGKRPQRMIDGQPCVPGCDEGCSS